VVVAAASVRPRPPTLSDTPTRSAPQLRREPTWAWAAAIRSLTRGSRGAIRCSTWARARENAAKHGFGNVEFRLGEIENLPLAEGTVDLVISNCVINLSPDKPRVFREALRVLRPGGRMVVSDIVLVSQLPESVRESVEAYVGCIAGASRKSDYVQMIGDAGFERVEVVEEKRYGATGEEIPDETAAWTAEAVRSVKVRAFKPQ
jgi:arsenite methyltransferase